MRWAPRGLAVGLCLLAFRALALPAAAPVPALSSAASELRITVDGIGSTDGTILIGLYDSAASFDRAIELSDKQGFLNDPARVAGAALRANLTMTGGVVFGNLEPGRYAIILFQDENGNGRLDKNFWGVPTEPYGFSNDARGFLGPPTFADAAMTLDGSDEAAIVTLIYHGGRSEPAGAPMARGDAPPQAARVGAKLRD